MGKKVLLLYISEDSGHHCASVAIERSLKALSPDTETLNINLFNYTNPIMEKVINGAYMSVVKRRPEIWDYLYDNPDVEVVLPLAVVRFQDRQPCHEFRKLLLN